MKTKNRPSIYIAGPMTSNKHLGPYAPVGAAAHAAKAIYAKGWLPFVPQLNSLWEMISGELVSGKGQEGWLEYDFAWVSRCDAICRLAGESIGADREVALAKELGIPVFYYPEVPVASE